MVVVGVVIADEVVVVDVVVVLLVVVVPVVVVVVVVVLPVVVAAVVVVVAAAVVVLEVDVAAVVVRVWTPEPLPGPLPALLPRAKPGTPSAIAARVPRMRPRVGRLPTTVQGFSQYVPSVSCPLGVIPHKVTRPGDCSVPRKPGRSGHGWCQVQRQHRVNTAPAM